MCGSDLESRFFFFLHCLVASSLWNMLFGIFGEESLGFPLGLYQFILIKFRGFGSRKGVKIMWKCYIYAVLLYIRWLERFARILNDSLSTLDFICCWFSLSASLWCSAHGLFSSSGVSLLDM